jgi:hypothetical protein
VDDDDVPDRLGSRRGDGSRQQRDRRATAAAAAAMALSCMAFSLIISQIQPNG